MNLGFGDAEVLADVITRAVECGQDIGSVLTLQVGENTQMPSSCAAVSQPRALISAAYSHYRCVARQPPMHTTCYRCERTLQGLWAQATHHSGLSKRACMLCGRNSKQHTTVVQWPRATDVCELQPSVIRLTHESGCD